YFVVIGRPSSFTPLPYTTLFRSPVQGQATGPRVRGARRAAEARPGSRRGTRGRGARAVPSRRRQRAAREPAPGTGREAGFAFRRSEEHTSELQSRENLVCRLLLE